jgi:hypothetical protein
VTAAEAKERFKLKFDTYSGYFTDDQLSDIINDALDRVIEIKLREAESDIKVLEELSPLVAYPSPAAPTTTIYTNKPADWKQAFSIKIKYTGTSYYKKATLLRENDAEDVFEAATTRYPKYEIRDKIFYYPTGASEITLVYIKNYTPVDITGSPNVELPLTNRKVQGLVMDEAVKIAAHITREDGMYQVTDKEVKENP